LRRALQGLKEQHEANLFGTPFTVAKAYGVEDLNMRRRGNTDFLLPTLGRLLSERGLSAEIEITGDIIRLRCSNGKETWVSKVYWLDALGEQRHSQEAELSAGLFQALTSVKVSARRIEENLAEWHSEARSAVATQGASLLERVHTTVQLGASLLRSRR